VASACEAAATAEALSAAVKFLPKDADPVMVITDDGRENVAVEDAELRGLLTRIVAQVELWEVGA
jgi:hypothetical protein